MLYSDNFLNELRSTVKEMLLNGNILEINKVKELLEYSNIEFGNFIAPMLKDDCSVSENSGNDISNDVVCIDTETTGNSFAAYSHLTGKVKAVSNKVTTVTAESRHGHYAEDGTYTEVPLEVRHQTGYLESKEDKTPKPKYMPYFHNTSSKGKLEGVVIYKLKAFIIEDLVTGKMLYKNTHHIARIFGLMHGEVISFNVTDDNRLEDITREDVYDFNDGINVVTNCPVLKDDDGYYVPTDMNGRSLTESGSPVSPYNIPYNVVDAYGIQEDDSVDLYIQPNSIPYVLYVHRGFYAPVETSTVTDGTKEAVKSTKGATKTKSRTFQKYDFDLKGKSVGFIGVPPSQKEKVTSLCEEKGTENYEFIDSSSHMAQVSIPQRFQDLDVIIVVKRFVGHGTIYQLKSLLKDSGASLINTSSHSVDAIERALYRGANGYPSEEGTVTVNYPLLKD
jgi:probable V-type sodium ATP synthase subunit